MNNLEAMFLGVSDSDLFSEILRLAPPKSIDRMNDRERLYLHYVILITAFKKEEVGRALISSEEIDLLKDSFAANPDLAISDMFLLSFLQQSFALASSDFLTVIQSWSPDLFSIILKGFNSSYRQAVFNLAKAALASSFQSDLIERYRSALFLNQERLIGLGSVYSSKKANVPIVVSPGSVNFLFDPEQKYQQGLKDSAGFTQPFDLPQLGIKTISFLVAGMSSLVEGPGRHSFMSVAIHEMIHQNQNQRLRELPSLAEALTESLCFLRQGYLEKPPFLIYKDYVLYLFDRLDQLKIPKSDFAKTVEHLNSLDPDSVIDLIGAWQPEDDGIFPELERAVFYGARRPFSINAL